MKLVTKELVGYEGQLLKGYKIYLTNLEKMASSLHRKKGDTRIVTNVSFIYIQFLNIYLLFIYLYGLKTNHIVPNLILNNENKKK